MKKILFALLCALPLLGLYSCSDDDKSLPNVDFNLAVSGGTVYEGQIYVVSDSTLSIDAINVINNEQGKTAVIPYANYYWDGFFIGRSAIAPFGMNIVMNSPQVPLGRHALTITCPVYAVDKEIAFSEVIYTVNVVASEEDMPDNGQATHTTTPKISDTEIAN